MGIAVVFAAAILLFRAVNSSSLLDAIYVLCSYTYGPLLGMFALALFTKRAVNDRVVPYIVVASPLLCWGIDTWVTAVSAYRFGYELLMLNGMLTFVGLWVTGNKQQVIV